MNQLTFMQLYVLLDIRYTDLVWWHRQQSTIVFLIIYTGQNY